VSEIRKWVAERGLAVDIEVDGGIGSHNVGLARCAGANVFVAGSAVFGKPDDGSPPNYAGRIAAIRENAGG
jgi:ribulose-phosphate 3-epimerase